MIKVAVIMAVAVLLSNTSEFLKIGATIFGVLIIRIPLFRVLY